MGNAALEHGAGGEILVQVQWIGVAGNAGKQQNIGISNSLRIDCRHADADVFEVMTMQLIHRLSFSQESTPGSFVRRNILLLHCSDKPQNSPRGPGLAGPAVPAGSRRGAGQVSMT